MKIQYQLARAAAFLLLAASSAHAQQAARDAADSQASVPATSYQSALAKPAEAAPAASPDANWIKSNETVAATNSMALTMKGMAGHSMHDHAAMHGMQGMNMDKKDSPAMCAPGGDKGRGMQCMPDQDKMSCCGAGCESCCCKDKMKKPKEAP